MPAKTVFFAIASGLLVSTWLFLSEFTSFASRTKLKLLIPGLETSYSLNTQISQIPLLSQQRNLSCEAAAIRMVLDFYQEKVSEDDILAKLPKNLNPNLGFRGNVDGKVWGINDYGVYAPVVAKVLEDFAIPSTAYTNINEGFLKQRVMDGKPAIIWVNTTNPNPKTVTTKVGKEQVKLVTGEHTVVVKGYKNGKWVINDPWAKTSPNGLRIADSFEVENLDSIYWHMFDHMAVIVN